MAYDGAAVETLFAIGEGHRVVGTHSWVTYPPETESIAKLGDAFDVDIEGRSRPGARPRVRVL